MSRLPRSFWLGVEHVAVGDDELVLQRGIGGIEAARRGRPGLGDQERSPGRADGGRPVRVPWPASAPPAAAALADR